MPFLGLLGTQRLTAAMRLAVCRFDRVVTMVTRHVEACNGREFVEVQSFVHNLSGTIEVDVSIGAKPKSALQSIISPGLFEDRLSCNFLPINSFLPTLPALLHTTFT